MFCSCRNSMKKRDERSGEVRASIAPSDDGKVSTNLKEEVSGITTDVAANVTGNDSSYGGLEAGSCGLYIYGLCVQVLHLAASMTSCNGDCNVFTSRYQGSHQGTIRLYPAPGGIHGAFASATSF